jgi:hypothetical protein
MVRSGGQPAMVPTASVISMIWPVRDVGHLHHGLTSASRFVAACTALENPLRSSVASGPIAAITNAWPTCP